MKHAIVTLKVLVLFCLVGLCQAVHAAQPLPRINDVNYDITVQIDPVARTIAGQSVIHVKNPRDFKVMLGSAYEVTQAELNDGPLGIGRERTDQPHIWSIPFNFTQQHRIVIHWKGLLSALDTRIDHQQTLGRPIAASSELGTFLPDASGWYPRVMDTLAQYKLKLRLPAGQRGLVAGRLLEESDTEQGYRAAFEFPFDAEGIDLIAGPYKVATLTHHNIKQRSVQLRTYFHPEIQQHAQDYLAATQRYLDLYENWIGEYPFSEFSVVSSPTPTGFGMPTMTYLGVSVLQLPFIRDTSLGHEVLHNWWGNGVYPDYRSGNWSEGLTTFMADYTYKERESGAAAREMRQGWLRDFAALQPGQDEPLVAFTSRMHGASKIVGYNKAAMLFLMLRDQLGESIFQLSLQGLWSTRRFKVTSWQNVRQMFEMMSGQPLEPFFDQWLNRKGAPDLAIMDARRAASGSGHELTLTLQQSAPAYQLRVPIHVESQQGRQIHILDFKEEKQTFRLSLPEQPVAVMLDPDMRLFRHLQSGEAPPILREIMVNPHTQTVLLSNQTELRNLAETLAGKLQEQKPQILATSESLSPAPVLVIGLQAEVDAWLARQSLPEMPEAVKQKGSARVWTIARTDGASVAIIAARDGAALEALVRPLPHYGRQSYLVFDGRQVIAKGIWPTEPLKTLTP